MVDFIILVSLFFLFVVLKDKIIVVDVGYGGYDFGMLGKLLIEKNLVLIIVKFVVSCLVNVGVNVFMMCLNDIFILLSGWVNVSEVKYVDVFISIYYNVFILFFVNGIVLFYYSEFKDKELVKYI